MIDLLVAWFLAVWIHVTIPMLQDLSIQIVNTRLPFLSSVLWKRDEEGKPVWGLVVSGSYKFDCCGCIDEQTSRLLAEEIDVRWEWPIFCDIAVAPVLGYLGQTRLKEQFDVNVDQGPLNIMELEYFRNGSEGGQTESRTNSRLGSPCDKDLDVGDLVDIAGEY